MPSLLIKTFLNHMYDISLSDISQNVNKLNKVLKDIEMGSKNSDKNGWKRIN